MGSEVVLPLVCVGWLLCLFVCLLVILFVGWLVGYFVCLLVILFVCLFVGLLSKELTFVHMMYMQKILTQFFQSSPSH